jgi:ATP-binding cassette subfamily B protein
MRELLRGLRLMAAISFGADAARSLAAIVTAVGQSLTVPLRAVGMKVFVDGALARDGRGAVGGALLVVGLSVVHRLMAWASFTIRMRLRENTQLHLDTRLMALVAGIPGLEHHERPDVLDKVELLRSERSYLANPWNPISWTVASIAQSASVVGMMLGVHPVLALLPLFALPSLILSYHAERAEADLRERQAAPARARRAIVELGTEPPAAKEIRIFGLADELAGRRRRLFDELERDHARVTRRNLALGAIGWAVFGAGYVLAAGFAVELAGTGRATVGAVVLVLALGGQLNQQLAELAGQVRWLVHTHRAVRRMLWLVDYADGARARVAPPRPASVPARLERGIELQGVSFAYPGTDRTVLAGVDLLLPAGSTVAVVGDNGAGKTTLVKLLCRFYEPTAGRVLVDGVALAELPVDEWRSRISAGFQDFARLQLVAREAIGVGDVTRPGSDDDIHGALDRAAAAELVASLPRGLDTQLGRDFEGGVDLSHGQWQKVALGRAMMRPAPLLLVLDEPTASLDAPTEHALFERFAGAARRVAARSGAVTVLVSHRFSTVRMADLILVVADGRIAEAGDHATLMRAGGLYAQLYEIQGRAYR